MLVQQKIVEILAEQAVLEPGEVPLDASLEDLGIDSMNLVEIIFAIEESFDIQIPFNANEPAAVGFDISSVTSIVSAVEGLLAAREA